MNFSEVLSAIKSQKSKILLGLISIFIFLFLFFPFSDLSSLVTSEVARLTQNQLFFQFDEMQIQIFPKPGITFGKVNVDAGQFPTIKADELLISPSPSAILTQTPAGSISAKGLFRGNVEISLGSGTKSEAGTPRQKIEIKADKLSLNELKEFRQIPILLKGNLSLQSKILADLSFSEQPDADIEIHAEKLEIPSQVMNTLMGPLNLPDLRLGQVDLKGKLVAGRLTLDEGKIGRDGDDIRGEIKGGITINVRNQNGIYPEVGAYSFDIDLSMKKATEDKLNIFLSLLSQYRTQTADGARYQIRMSAQNPAYPPSITNLR